MSLFSTRALPLSRVSSQWVEVSVTGAQSKWTECHCNYYSMSMWLFLLSINPQLDWQAMKCDLFLIVTDNWILGIVMASHIFGGYGNMLGFVSTDIAIFSFNVSQTCHTQLRRVNRQLYGHLKHTLLVAMATCWFPWQPISQCSLLILPRLPLLKCNAIIGHYRPLRKFFDHHGNRCQGNLIVVFFL